MEQRERLGVVVEGTLQKGLQVRLDADQSVERMRVGKFVVVDGEVHQFFSMVTDVLLGVTNEDVLINPPPDGTFLSQVLRGTTTFGKVEIAPMLMIDRSVDAAEQRALPVRTIPTHFSVVHEADQRDFEAIFDRDDVSGAGKGVHMEIGRPLDMEVPVCINLSRLVERSNGVFGKSGTGKSFLTRLLLSGIIKSGVATNLIFDMHSEYGWDSRSEEGTFVRGLRQLFGAAHVMVFSLDPQSSAARGVQVDESIVIGLNQIEVEDVALLQEELKLNPTAVESAYLFVDRFKEKWLQTLLGMSTEEVKLFADAVGGHPSAIAALKRKLEMVKRKDFVHEEAPFSAIDNLIACLEKGKHVVLEFGQHRDPLSYILVANIITRRIHRLWVEKTERYLQTKDEVDRPRQLVITLEEAHKFLNPEVCQQTIFGTIAREMRKYGVTLLIVDQRPSGIDSEVLSQIGTRVTALLNDEKDIEAVFTGVSGGARLRAVLATLDTRQQALILGHAMRMPVVVRCRAYDEEFYRAMNSRAETAAVTDAVRSFEDLFPDP